MSDTPRIYLDNAATSWPKPPAVCDAVDDYLRHVGAPAGRGAYRAGQEVERRIDACRRDVAKLVGSTEPRRVVFGFNGTDVLNMALHGMLRPDDHVVTSQCEHNSVLRPLRWLQEHRDVEVSHVKCDAWGVLDADDVLQATQANTRLVAITHASNVTGALQPIEALGPRLREREIYFLVDAAQSLGHVPVDVDAAAVDLLAASGHKGLLGPLGTGVLYVGPRCDGELESFRQGGTGTQSETDEQPGELPHKMESGNLNVPALFGLAAGVGFVLQQGVEESRKHDLELNKQLREVLAGIEGVSIFGPDVQTCTGVTSFAVDGVEPQEVASLLDSAFNIQLRAGLHCAPRIHEALGTLDQGGTVRASFGPFNSQSDVAALIDAITQVVTSFTQTG